MSKGSERRPTQITDEEFQKKWDRAFAEREKKPLEEWPARDFDTIIPSELVDELTTPLPRGRPREGPEPVYQWAVFFRHAGWLYEKLGGEFEKEETARLFSERLVENGATTRIERIA